MAAALLATAGQAGARDLSLPLTGNLLGSVVDAGGIPQMGASVQLFNKYARLIARTNTAPDGRFAFASLPVDLYSIRVSLDSFLPAAREKIAIKAGLDSILQIHLATLFSNVEVSYAIPDAAMTDDWKWVLRSSPATRPINRLLPLDPDSPSSPELHPRIFSGTHVMLSMSGGDGGLIDSDSTQGDFGTGFALSTNVMGKNQVQVAGTFGQNSGIGPAAMALAAIYSRNDTGAFGAPPEVTFTMTQLGGLGPQMTGGQGTNAILGSTPVMRAMSLSVYQVADPLEDVHIEYGMTGESVDYVQHASRISPFARMTIDAGRAGQVIAAYSDGARPDELSAHQQYQAAADTDVPDNDFVDTVNMMARLPQLSDRNGVLELQRTQNYELGYNKRAGSRTYALSAFYEDVSNGQINVAGNLSVLDQGDLMSDGMSITSRYNIGNYQRDGYVASVNQKMTDRVDVAIAYGRMGGFTADAAGLSGSSGVQQRFLDGQNHNIAAANLLARIPVSGTRISASYGWVDSGAVVPRHIFTTQNTYVEPGLNIDVRQPLPFFGTPGHLELTGNLRNLLAQGYLPFDTGDGRTLLMVQAPRAVRGGLNFIF